MIFIGLFSCWAAGCAQQAQRPVPDDWVSAKGGCVNNISLDERMSRACARLRLPVRTVLRVLASGEPAAYTWPNGEVYVTTGLIDLLDDEELAAALAHEMGHRASTGRSRRVLSLRGRKEGLEAELEADRVGVSLLRAAAIRPEKMAVMLSKVRDGAHLKPVYVADINRRIERLRGSLTPTSR